jgi:hypothetical protein
MKSRTLFLTAAALLVMIGVLLFALLSLDGETLPIFPATINRDCAPWDGAAFTVLIPLEEGETIQISIYRSPDIQLPSRYSFPDASMQEGHAQLLLPVDAPEPLTGNVTFQRVEQGATVQGQFGLATQTGRQLQGEFLAEWGNEIVYCG